MKDVAKAGIALSFIVVALGYVMVVLNIITLNKSKRLGKING